MHCGSIKYSCRNYVAKTRYKSFTNNHVIYLLPSSVSNSLLLSEHNVAPETLESWQNDPHKTWKYQETDPSLQNFGTIPTRNSIGRLTLHEAFSMHSIQCLSKGPNPRWRTSRTMVSKVSTLICLMKRLDLAVFKTGMKEFFPYSLIYYIFISHSFKGILQAAILKSVWTSYHRNEHVLWSTTL